ncbi:hypothetical protein [Mesorhizobium sp. 1M-11]|uniref:hypothetical protein n=1 Tax=Mesorhizobium sp. 1M-11 TaxID=1529006 RepID=UPI0006C7617C|nr:hypothetical protein [Mesorhizobium sp. 1M-11]
MTEPSLVSIAVETTVPVPLYLRKFEIAVDYSPSHGEADREPLEDAVRELQGALRLGFFSWSFLSSRQSARLSIGWRNEQGFVLPGEAEGLHHNVLVAALRLIVNLHHTPQAAYEEARAALGEDADALPARSIFSEIVAGIRIVALEGVDERLSDRTNFEDYSADAEISVPESRLFSDTAELCEHERVVAAIDETAGAFSRSHLDRLEDLFLRACDGGCFRNTTRIDELGGNAEIFLRRGKAGSDEVIIDDYEDEYYGLVEFLNCLSDGRVASVSLSDGE